MSPIRLNNLRNFKGILNQENSADHAKENFKFLILDVFSMEILRLGYIEICGFYRKFAPKGKWLFFNGSGLKIGAVIFCDKHRRSAVGSKSGLSEITPDYPYNLNDVDLLKFFFL